MKCESFPIAAFVAFVADTMRFIIFKHEYLTTGSYYYSFEIFVRVKTINKIMNSV